MLLSRREFLRLVSVAAAFPAACVTTRRSPDTGVWVNDVHSALNRTQVAAIETPRSIHDLQRLVRDTGSKPLCIAGSRHAMGGQQFATDGVLIDARSMHRVLGFDQTRGIIDIEPGIEWPALLEHLQTSQKGATRQWGFAQKQTGADHLTLGGALAANAHGRGLKMKPMAGDVESFVLVDARGESIECSRTQNRELFSLVIGGYGLFGALASIKLRLLPRQKVKRVVEVQSIETVMDAFERRIADGFTYGDFQFSIDAPSDTFLRSGVFSCYVPVSDDTPMPETQAELRPEDWTNLIALAHFDKQQAYERYVGYYLSTSGQVYWSDAHQMSFYPAGYHTALDARAKSGAATEIITELYVPRPRLADFMMAARELIRQRDVSVIYGTVRLIERDDDTFLPWAKDRYACVIFNLHTDHSPAGQARSADAFRGLIDLALARQGSYFLTYHRYARRDQVEAAYPQFAEFLRLKRRYDPGQRFQSDWYRHYQKMFGAA